MISLDRALAIEGWTAQDELLWLALQASTRHRVVELGCWKGRSTRALAEHTPGTVYAIDTWRGSAGEPEHQEARRQSEEELGQFTLNILYRQFKANLSDLPGKVVALMGDGTVAAQELLRRYGPTFDMVFIDAEHTTESVTRDIENYRKLLRPGGLLCGHDYNWNTVKVAVDHSLGKVGTFLTIWYKQV